MAKAAWEQPLWGPGGAGPSQLLFSVRGRLGFPGGTDGKESSCNVGDLGSIPGLGRSPGGGHGNPFQYSCLEDPHGQRSLVGYSPWDHKESDTTERLTHIRGGVCVCVRVWVCVHTRVLIRFSCVLLCATL